MNDHPHRRVLDRLLFGNYSLAELQSADMVRGVSPTLAGDFRISGSALSMMEHWSDEQFVRLRRELWEANRAGETILVTSDFVRGPRGSVPKFQRRADDLLKRLAEWSETSLGRPMHFFDRGPEKELELFSLLGVSSQDAVLFFFEYLEKRGFIQRYSTMSSLSIKVELDGYVYLDTLSADRTSRTRGFVAMWFAEDMAEAWSSGLKPAIEEAGYEAFRIDRHEHVNRIDDEILASIRNSRFLVADFTSEPDMPRGGVYFEAGFAQGLGLPVFWTARDTVKDQIHFDTRQYNHIFWADMGDLRLRLKHRIVSILGQGPLPIP